MANTKEQYPLKCKQCGVELTDKNCYERVDGVSCDCEDCEQAFYDKLAEQMGFSLALYLCCVRYNVPCEPMLIPDDFGEKTFEGAEARWLWYLNALIESEKYLAKDNTIRGFTDGVKNMFRIFGKEMTEKDFSRYCLTEREKLDKLPGTAEQREQWGMQDLTKGLPMTTTIYNQLDAMYKIKVSRYKGVTLDEMLESTLRRLVKLEMAQEYLRSIGDFGGFDKVQKSIDNISASEQLRKKDEKPVENFTPDAWIDAFEKAGLMQDGQFLTLHEVENAMIKIMRGRGYEQTLDAAHQLELNIVNNARKNADQQTIFELPDDMRISDELGEFAKEETDDEKEAKAYAQLTTVRFENKKDKP